MESVTHHLVNSKCKHIAKVFFAILIIIIYTVMQTHECYHENAQ